MQKPRITVIIPVYNVEKYLERCVDSVLVQTLDRIEIILVDDGSPDNSPKICDRYAAQYDSVSVIHKSNGGLASARNAGLKLATGDYIFFLDSDDWLEKDGMETLYSIAIKYNVDLVKYRAIRTGWPGLPENAPCMVEQVRELRDGYYSKEQIIKEIYPKLFATPQLTMGAVVGAWGALYNRQFLEDNELSFYEEVKFSEDTIFSANVIKSAQSMYFINEHGVYHYFYNPDSISKSFRAGRWNSCKELISLFEKDFSNNSDFDFSIELYQFKWFCIFLALGERRFLHSIKEKKEYCKTILFDDVIKETEICFKGLDIPFKQKVLMIIIKLRLYRTVSLI